MVQWITLNGLTQYKDMIHLMESKVLAVIKGGPFETIYLLQHDDVYTAGTNYQNDELLNPGNIPVIYTGRGGKFTYHGIGQRIIYPILNLSYRNKKDIKLYINMLQQWIMATLSRLNLEAYIIDDKIGVWIKNKKNNDAKIAAIGIRVKKWVTYHGIAVNISNDLTKYKGIIPCGLQNDHITSLFELGIDISFDQFDLILKSEFESIFGK